MRPNPATTPDAGREKVELGSAKYDLGRKLEAIVTLASKWEDAAEKFAAVLRDTALAPPEPAAPLSQGAVDVLAERRRQVEELRIAAQPFVDFASAGSFNRLPDRLPLTQGSVMARRQVTAGDFKALRRAVQGLDANRATRKDHAYD